MKKRALSLLLTLAMVVSLFAGLAMSAHATDLSLTFDLTTNPGEWPTANSTTLTDYTYTLDNETYTFALKNVKQNSGYLMLTQVAVLGLPAISGYKLTEVVAHNSSTGSTSVRVGISDDPDSASYINGGAYQTWSTQGSSYTYTLTDTAADTMYYLYVTNKNAQIISLELTYAEVSATAPDCTHESTTLTGYVAATCTVDGYTGDYICDECGSIVTAGTVIPATGHTYVDGVCTVCGAVDTETIIYEPVTAEPSSWTGEYLIGHLDSTSGDVWVFNGTDAVYDYVAATPDQDGKITYAAGMAKVTIAAGTNGYTLSVGENKYMYSTGTSNGLTIGATANENTIAYSNDGVVITYGSTTFRFNATYGQDRFRYFKTSSTGNAYTYPTLYKLVDPNACTHENTTLTGYVAATCTTDGYTGSYVCDDCGAIVTPGSVIAALGHTWGAWTVSTAAACTTAGEQTRTCSVCQATDTEAIPATGHTYVDGVCTVCGAEEPATVYYQKVTTEPADWAGDYILVYEAGNDTAYVFTGVSAANTYAEAAITAAGIAFDETTMAHLTIATMTGGYSILVNGGTNDGKYIGGGTSGANVMHFNANETLNTIAYNGTDSCVDITSNTSVLRWNNTATTGHLFRYYKSSTYTSMQPVQLYKLVCDHDFSCNDNGNGTHTVSCANCDYSVTEAHTFDEGVCTVCGAVDTQTVDLKIETASLTLYEDIVVNFAASVPTGLTDPYMIIEINGQSYTVIPNREDSEGRLVFEFTNLTPDMMGDNIKSTVYATTAGGQLVHYCKPTYSVRQYCTNVMAAYPEDAKLQTLLADMLVYGAATQTFTGHNADSLVTAGLDLAAASTFTDPPASDLSMTDTTDANIQWTGAGLECGSRMSMYFTLTTAAGDATSVSVTINGRTTVYEYADIVTDDPTVCRVVFRGISASEYGDVVTAVVKNNGAPVQTLTYSVNSYINSKYNDPNVENLAQLVQAICNYGASASNYIN